MVWKVFWRVDVGGTDVSARMQPFLMSIEVTDKDGWSSDTCTLSLDDSQGQCFLPRDGALVSVYLQGAVVFVGTVDDVKSEGARSSGRSLQVTARGFDSRGQVKTPLQFHQDRATLKDFLSAAAREAGISSVAISPELAGVTRDYWAARGESFLHLGRRLAEEHGASFKIRGHKAVFVKRGAGLSPAGQSLPLVTAAWGVNLIAWSITPFVGRAHYTKAKAHYFDRKQAAWKNVETQVQGRAGAPEATDGVRFSRADHDEARSVAQARASDSERKMGEGTVELDLTPEARAEGTCIVSGARPGVDGTYRITGVTHRADRGGGSTTSLELKQPQGAAGKDIRKVK